MSMRYIGDHRSHCSSSFRESRLMYVGTESPLLSRGQIILDSDFRLQTSSRNLLSIPRFSSLSTVDHEGPEFPMSGKSEVCIIV